MKIQIIKCDKCGRQLEEYQGRLVVVVPTRSDLSIDLCEECWSMFYNFLGKQFKPHGRIEFNEPEKLKKSSQPRENRMIKKIIEYAICPCCSGKGTHWFEDGCSTCQSTGKIVIKEEIIEEPEEGKE